MAHHRGSLALWQVRYLTELAVDVLVYGGTSAGVTAAYTAKTHVKSVLLVEPVGVGRESGGGRRAT